MTEKQNRKDGNGNAEGTDEGGGNDGLLSVANVFGPIFCDQARNGKGDAGSCGGGQDGEHGQGDLVDAHAFRTECARQDDAI